MMRFGRAVTEIGFIIFLFYTNLLMGEFTRSGMARGRGFVWAIQDVFSAFNFGIALAAALIGSLVVEFLRRKL
jgi:Trk-type K+ transport system membrane component